MSHIFVEDKSSCFGCCACFSVCPQSAIKMLPDEEGFIYPMVDEEKCVGCSLCVKVCPNDRLITGKGEL